MARATYHQGMNTFFTVDTLRLSKRFEKAGMKKELADVMAEELKEINEGSSKEVATKKDLQILDQRLQVLDQRLTAKCGSMIIAATLVGIGFAAWWTDFVVTTKLEVLEQKLGSEIDGIRKDIQLLQKTLDRSQK